MNILQIVPTISEAADGVGDFVRHLGREFYGAEIECQIAALVFNTIFDEQDYIKTFKVSCPPKRLGISFGMRKWLVNQVESGMVDIVHNHGLWMMPNIYSGIANRSANCKLVVSPHGALAPWAMNISSFQKGIFWHLLQRGILERASCFHATSEREYLDIRKRGFRQPVVVIPPGVDLPKDTSTKVHGGRRRLLFLARINPIKGVDTLLRSWAVVQDQFPEWDLIIAGPDNSGYLGVMKTLARNLSLRRIYFKGPLYGEEKHVAFREANVYVLPSHTENFGITIAESLAAGTPVITTKGTPWSELHAFGAGWWIDHGVEPLASCLEEVLSQSDEILFDMGSRGKRWVKDEFSWKTAGEKFFAVYHWLKYGGDLPPEVRLT